LEQDNHMDAMLATLLFLVVFAAFAVLLWILGKVLDAVLITDSLLDPKRKMNRRVATEGGAAMTTAIHIHFGTAIAIEHTTI